MTRPSARDLRAPLRIGAVSYLNSRPLIAELAEFLPNAHVEVDLPSRLADRLVRGDLDVGLVPSIESFRVARATVVSDACVACDGPVRSVKLYGRVPIQRVRTLALDEGSRTSAAVAQIVLREQFGLDPVPEPLPIGASLEDSAADAVMLIGDRAMYPTAGRFAFVWDLGEAWSDWTGLPLVFALWVARPGVDLDGLDDAFSAARDSGTAQVEAIARRESARLGLPEEDCLAYLRDHLQFRLGERERAGLEEFRQLAVKNGLLPSGAELAFHPEPSA